MPVETSTVLMLFGRGRQRHDIYRNPNHNAHLRLYGWLWYLRDTAEFPCGPARRMTKCLAVASGFSRGLGSRLCRKLKSITPLTFSTAPTASSVHRIHERIVFPPWRTAKASCPEIFSATQRPGLLLQSLSNSSAFPKAQGELCSRR